MNAAFSDDKPTAQAAQQKIQEAYDATAGNYGYYENVYTDLTEEIADNLSNKKFTFPGENPGDDVSKALLIRNHQLSTAGQTTSLPVLGGIQDADLAGSQEDPYIYLGKNIDSYPYYQYALVGDLKYVIQKAQESAADTQAEMRRMEVRLPHRQWQPLPIRRMAIRRLHWRMASIGTGSLMPQTMSDKDCPFNCNVAVRAVSYQDGQKLLCR